MPEGSLPREGAHRGERTAFGNTEDVLESRTVYTKQTQLAELARKLPGRRLVSLNHHLDLEWLEEACRRTRKDGAPGVDGMTWEEYSRDLPKRLTDLLERAKDGDSYRAPPARRVHIPKGNGETRPLGIPTLETKILERAIVMVLEPIYEQEFLPCSYGFRPGRSPHQALQSLWRQIMATGGCWLIDADISKFFDTLDRAILRDFLNQRVGDAMLSEAFILKNRMREIRSYGSVGGLGREAQVYPERPACAGRRRRFG